MVPLDPQRNVETGSGVSANEELIARFRSSWEPGCGLDDFLATVTGPRAVGKIDRATLLRLIQQGSLERFVPHAQSVVDHQHTVQRFGPVVDFLAPGKKRLSQSESHQQYGERHDPTPTSAAMTTRTPTPSSIAKA